ncbi:hypothetical protein BVC80_8695g11 [Macleaya cordata]|uniref:Uncharacterized protein n=1 Tax=Macleaya cordata TaxID=56857 RepID=A0A200PPR5_MACCD|nr:hypothetical protein BVC80_8695g11 [Macleaya cordata]
MLMWSNSAFPASSLSNPHPTTSSQLTPILTPPAVAQTSSNSMLSTPTSTSSPSPESTSPPTQSSPSPSTVPASQSQSPSTQ